MSANIKNQNKTKILWNSNAAFTGTGYGVQTGECVYRISKRGFDVRVASNYGLEGAALNINGVVQYPHSFTKFSEDVLEVIMANWKPDIFVTLFDIWVGKSSSVGENWFSKLANDHGAKWIPWIPIDQYPVADGVAEQAALAYKPVAMSKFGLRELQRVGLTNATYIPHGVNTNVFKPAEDKRAAKKYLETHSSVIDVRAKSKITEDSFIVGVNAMNKDPLRKDWGRMLTAFQIFLENEPDAKKDAVLYLHTYIHFPGGFRLDHLTKKLGISKYVKHTHIYDMICGLPSDRMNAMYNACDVSMLLSRGEGFGVPIIESKSCGVPVVGTDYSAITELIDGDGWRVPLFAGDVECPECKKRFSYNGGAKMFDHLITLYALPDEFKAAEALADAYNHPDKVKQFGERARADVVKNYDFDNCVLPKWFSIFDEIDSAKSMFGAGESKREAFDALCKELI